MFKKMEKYAWPGGYQITYVNDDNDILCPRCAMIEQRKVQSFIHWEGSDEHCARCEKTIESEYGEVVE